MIAVAREVLDEEGLAGLSMARLAERLGLTTMAVYRYVRDRRELEQAVAQSVLADLAVAHTADEDWREALVDWMTQLRSHWQRHPWIAGLLGDSLGMTPPWMACVDGLAQILENAGLAPDEVARELVRITRTLIGVVSLEVAAPLPDATGLFSPPIEEGERRWSQLAPELARYSNDDLFNDLTRATLDRISVHLEAETRPTNKP